MTKLILKRLGKFALLIAVILIPVVIIPQVYDPVGVRLLDDRYEIHKNLQCANANCTRLRMPAGTITFAHGWRATIEADGRRLVPNNNPDCTLQVALIGDSYTWGPLVNDDETWANGLAQHFPSACFYNYGMYGFNAEQVALTLAEAVPDEMDMVLYFVFTNDDVGPIVNTHIGSPPSPLNIVLYVELIRQHAGLREQAPGMIDFTPDPAQFAAAIHRIGADPRVQFVGFEHEIRLHEIREMGYPATEIPWFSEDNIIAPIDNHPTAEGHREIAQALFPLVREQLLLYNKQQDVAPSDP
ncbi:MAG: SGNH/GDSL hydrolase family protein [Anaerolineae bacterium]|nr:SGNH/GDSL hydrolase family protein [Anaerolineae bacterium]